MSAEWIGLVGVALGAALGSAGTLLSTLIANRTTERVSKRTEDRETRNMLLEQRRGLYAKFLDRAGDAWAWVVDMGSSPDGPTVESYQNAMSPMFQALTELLLAAPSSVHDKAQELARFILDFGQARLRDSEDRSTPPSDEYRVLRTVLIADMRDDLVNPALADSWRAEDES